MPTTNVRSSVAAAAGMLIPVLTLLAGMVTAAGAQSTQDAEAPPPPPGTEKVVNYDRHGEVTAACAQKAGEPIRSGQQTIPPTEVWITNGRAVWKTATGLGTCDPSWSPDGSRLAVATADGIWILSGPSQEKGERLTDTRDKDAAGAVSFTKPQWSPDGARMAVVVRGGSGTWAEVLDVSTGKQIFKSDSNVSSVAWGDDSRSLRINGKIVPLTQ